MKTCRRDFLKISALTIGGLATSRIATPIPMVEDTEKYKDSVATYCEVCFWKCSGLVNRNQYGDLIDIKGNKEDVLSNGRLCPRGIAGVEMFKDPNRLKRPLMRVGKPGSQEFKEVSWPTAFDYIYKKTNSIIEESGAESLALFNHGSGGKHFVKLFKALGSGNIAAPSFAQCRGPREVAFKATFGKDMGSPEPLDIENSKCIVLLGSHLGENMHNTQVQELFELKRRGGKIITVDPRFSTVASKSDIWLPIKASTDIALLLAWMNIIIANDWYDRDYVDKYCFGFEDLQAHVEPFTASWASKETGLAEEDIYASARVLANEAPATIIHPGRHVTWYGDDTQRVRGIAILNALLGSYGRKGGIFLPQKAKVPPIPHPAYPKPEWTWRDNHEGKYNLSPTAISNLIIDSSIKRLEPKHLVKGWYVVGSNLIETIPDQKKTMEAIMDLELLVVVDTMPAEITGYADIVLPECTYLERYDDLRVSPYRSASVAIRKPAARPQYSSKPSHWMARKLAYKFGLSSHFNYDDYDDILKQQAKMMNIDYNELSEKGVVNFENEKTPYFEEDEIRTFDTPTGMIELYSFTLEDEGFDPMPNYIKHEDPPEGFLRLNYGRAPMHTFGRTQNNRVATSLMDENPVWIHPDIAENLGIDNTDRVKLITPSGKVSTFSSPARLTQRMSKDSVYLVHGFGQKDTRLKQAFGKGISDTELMENIKIDPITGATGMRNNFVKIVKA